jgi:hypothetical protein
MLTPWIVPLKVNGNVRSGPTMMLDVKRLIVPDGRYAVEL